MVEKFNFILNANKPFSKECIALGLKSFSQVCDYIKLLPYGRNKNRSNYSSILKEQKGTCSTKHAFLKQIALEGNQEIIELYIGIYKMNESNTKGLGSILNKYKLDYIPEAHSYLKVEDTIIDITRETQSLVSFQTSIIRKETILPEQIGDYKITYHQDFLKGWIISESIPYSFEKIWSIREDCILNLSL